MPLLESYKPLLDIYLILGVCPFRVNSTKNSVERTIFSLCYSVLLYVILAILLFYFYRATLLHDDILETCESGTCNYALIIQSLIVFVLFILSSLNTAFYRSDHVQLLNDIVEMETSLNEHFNIEMFPKKLVRQVCVRDSLFVATHFVLNISAIYCMQINQNFDITIYHYLYAIEMLIISLTIIHVIAICMILKHCSQLLLDTIKQLIPELSVKNSNSNIKIYQIFHFLDKINVFKIRMGSVFGFRLLINQTMDFVLVTVAVYYFILVNMPKHFEFHWIQIYFAIVYVAPVLLKNFSLVAATDTLGNQVNFGIELVSFYNYCSMSV